MALTAGLVLLCGKEHLPKSAGEHEGGSRRETAGQERLSRCFQFICTREMPLHRAEDEQGCASQHDGKLQRRAHIAGQHIRNKRDQSANEVSRANGGGADGGPVRIGLG